MIAEQLINTDDLVMLDRAMARFLETHAPPHAVADWRAQGQTPRELWNRAGEAGFLCPSMPIEYGGAGGDFRHEAVVLRRLMLHGLDGWGVPLHNGIVAPYLLHYGSERQKSDWLPRMASGELVGAIAMTEPGAGSDLQAIDTRADADGDSLLVSGAKTFITNGQAANFVLVVAKTDRSEGARGISLIGLETDGASGFRRGRNLEKLGMELGDTSELFFDGVRVPRENIAWAGFRAADAAAAARAASDRP